MVKRIVIYILTVLITLALFYIGHTYLLKHRVLSYDLLNVYLFHAIASVIVYVILELVAAKLPNQAGYAFLAGVFLKIGFFILLFQAEVFPEESLPKYEKISLIVPLFLFLIIEAIAGSRLLNSK